MTDSTILVACVGNIFLGDDAFGVEVARLLAGRPLPDGVRVVDFGIRGLDLTYALLDGYEAVILVDTSPQGEAPGTLFVIEPDVDEAPAEPVVLETHNLDPVRVLRMAESMGGHVGRLLVVGCEPTPFDESRDIRAGLSEPVRHAVQEAVPLIESLINTLRLEREAITLSGEG